MTPHPLEIFTATLPLGHSHDRRPWVVIEAAGPDRWRLLPISAAVDLFDPELHFRLDPSHPDFPLTGLKRASFIVANLPVDAPQAVLERRLGCLQSQLAAEFLNWLSA